MALYLGLISGTSMDGIDAALLDVDGSHLSFRTSAEYPYPPPLRERLERLVRSRAAPIDEVGSLHTALGQVFAAAALKLLAESNLEPTAVTGLGSHGQTIGHGIDGDTPYTLQIGDPHVIALRTGIRTVADFRAMDVAAGGQGAPLVPGFHRQIFRRDTHPVAVVNIGGIANVSLLDCAPGAPLLGFDCGPGNTLLDLWMQRHRGQAFDADGSWAATGTVNEALLRALLEEAYFSRTPPKSTGRELFHLDWLDARLASIDTRPTPVDVQATLAQLTVIGIANAVERYQPGCREVVVCGGGARNSTLMAALRSALGPGRQVVTSDERGWPSGAIEACTFAWLASRRLAGQPGNEPSVTGARSPVLLGAIYEAGKG